MLCQCVGGSSVNGTIVSSHTHLSSSFEKPAKTVNPVLVTECIERDKTNHVLISLDCSQHGLDFSVEDHYVDKMF